MDSSFTIKPAPQPGLAKSRALRDPITVRQTADTELSAYKTVSGLGDGNPRDHGSRDPRDSEHRGDHTPHDLVANPASRDVIYRERDVRAAGGEHPDHALQRLRAYRPASTDSGSPAEDHADFKA